MERGGASATSTLGRSEKYAMSWDVELEVQVDTGSTEPQTLVLGDWNYTYNYGDMFCAAGGRWWELDGAIAADAAEIVAGIVKQMEADPAKFTALNPANGWGSYDMLLPRLREMEEAMRQHCKAIVRMR